MSAKASYFKIGLFVVASATVLLFAIVVLGAAALFKTYTYVVTYLDESVQGLSVGSPVKLRGVDIGRVHEIRLARDKYNFQPAGERGVGVGFEAYQRYGTLVVVTIALEDPRLIDLDLAQAQGVVSELGQHGWRLRLTSSGLTSPPYLELVPGAIGDDAVDISAGLPWQEAHDKQLYLPSSRSQMTELTSSIENIVRNLDQADFSRLTGSLTSFVENELSPAVHNLNDGVMQLPDLMAKLDNVAGNIDRMTLSLQQLIDEKLPTILDQVEHTTDQMPALVERVTSAAESADRLARDLGQLTQGEIQPAMQQLRELVASIQKMSDEQLTPTISHLNDASNELPASVDQFNSGLRRLNMVLADGQSSMSVVLENLQRVSDDLRKVSEQASRYPSHTLFGDPPPRSLGRQK
ncbi:MAG: MlaD family protein [Planctomycetota bacterium]